MSTTTTAAGSTRRKRLYKPTPVFESCTRCSGPNGRKHRWCRPCERAVRAEKTYPTCGGCGQPNDRQAKYNTCSNCQREAGRRWALRKYGVTEADIHRMQEEQQGLCAICSRPPRSRGFMLDHCHASGIVRGLLCHPCNSAIGLLKDDEDILVAAINYLRKAKRVTP